MRSVRLDDELEIRLAEASRVTGEPASRIIREGISRRCEEILDGGGSSMHDRLADVIGAMSSTPAARRRTDSRRTGRAFATLLASRRKGGKPRSRR